MMPFQAENKIIVKIVLISFYFSMEEVLTNKDAVRTGWMILLMQLFISILVAMFVVKKARLELDKILISKKCQIISDLDLKLVVCEK